MKVGEHLKVFIEGYEVGYAQIEDISDGKATLIIPATRVVMGVKQSLVDIEPEVETDRVLAGVAEAVGDEGSDAADEAESAVEQERKSLRERDLDSSDID